MIFTYQIGFEKTSRCFEQAVYSIVISITITVAVAVTISCFYTLRVFHASLQTFANIANISISISVGINLHATVGKVIRNTAGISSICKTWRTNLTHFSL